MYITITPQKLGSNYLQSARDFVDYLEKENEGKPLGEQEHFFDQEDDRISAKHVQEAIDSNTAKLKRKEPKFYSLTINPSARELQHIKNNPRALTSYTRQLMEDYAKAFHREIEGAPVRVKDLLYFAKIEHTRIFKGTDRAVRENQPYIAKIARIRHEMVLIKKGELAGDLQGKEKEIRKLQREAPHRQEGKMIEAGMGKTGAQSHIHIIISRKDRSNRYSLSPGSKYKASTTVFQGKEIKRGFDREAFFQSAEQRFDRKFHYQRNYVESYQGRNTLLKDPQRYWKQLMGLSKPEKKIAFELLKQTGIKLPIQRLPLTPGQLAAKVLAKLKRGVGKALQSGSIEL